LGSKYGKQMTAPAPLACLSCGYDVSSIQTPRCPECGGALAEQDRASMARLRTLLDAGDAVPWRHVIAWALVIVIYSAGAAVMNGNVGFHAHFSAAVLLSIACYGSLAFGNVAFLGLDRPRRLAAIDAWRRELWLLHVPWLLIALAAPIILAVALALKAAGRYEEDTLVAGGVGLLVWLPCSIAAFIVFLARARRRLASLGANTREARVRLWLAALLVLSGALFLGFGGGLLARYGAARFAELTWESDQW
jgi:hypothetical protein